LDANNKWALITGASSGIGRALAHAFASRGYSLFLTARNEPALRRVAADCAEKFKIATEIYRADLSDPQAVDALITALSPEEHAFEILVNNAGFGVQGAFRKTALDAELSMVHVQVDVTLKMTKALLPGMVARRSGRILNVASVYSFAPVAFQSVYAASKAFMLSFSAALSEELRGSGVTVTALCPGLTQTEFRVRAGIPEKNKVGGATAEHIAEIAARQTLKGKRVVVPGLPNHLFAFLARRLPLVLVPRIVRFINKTRGVNP
jgi:short-subunit dehydrogenase